MQKHKEEAVSMEYQPNRSHVRQKCPNCERLKLLLVLTAIMGLLLVVPVAVLWFLLS
jgi:hypothetical protein